MRAARADAPNSLLFDNADRRQGSPMVDLMTHGPRPLQRAPFIRPTGCFQETARRLVQQRRAADSDLITLIPHVGFERGATPRCVENAVARLARHPQVHLVKDNADGSVRFERVD